MIITILFSPFVFIMRLLKPVVLIRLGQLRSERIGSLVTETEIYLSELDLGIYDKAFDIFYYTQPVCNKQLMRMMRRKIHIWNLVRFIDYSNRRIPGGEAHYVPKRKDHCRDIHGVLPLTKTHLEFTELEKVKGELGTRWIGVPSYRKIICFHARDSLYLNYLPGDWSYHNYRDADIQDFLPAVEKISYRGYTMVRMGAKVKDKLPKIHGVIDYATTERTDFMDIYLCSRCKFFLGTNAGIIQVAMMFRKPVVCVNVLPYKSILSFSSNDLVICKRLWHIKEKRFLSFKEIINSEIFTYAESQKYIDAGLEVVDNTPEEIFEATEEMNDLLDRRRTYTQEEIDRQKSFKELLGEVGLPIIGSKFLRRYNEQKKTA